MVANLWFSLQTAWRFKCYRRKKVTPIAVLQWLHQFNAHDQKLLRKLIRKIYYVPESELRGHLIAGYRRLVEFLKNRGFRKEQIIFLSFDQAGSSSAAMLNLLRDEAHLENQKFHILDARDIDKLTALTYELGESAVIYVDDFVGSGKQLTSNLTFVRPLLQGDYTEAVLAVCICEEAVSALEELGVHPEREITHYVRDRPLHKDAEVLPTEDKSRLLDLCKLVGPPTGLGFQKMATMVVLSRNTPNNCPMVFRGTKGQVPFVGLLPRTTDLEVPPALKY